MPQQTKKEEEYVVSYTGEHHQRNKQISFSCASFRKE